MSEEGKQFLDDAANRLEAAGMEVIRGTTVGPDWWGENERRITFQIQQCMLLGHFSGEQACELFRSNPAALYTASQLWLLKAAMLIDGEDPILKSADQNGCEDGEGRDDWFQVTTWALCAYADSLGIYTPNLVEFQVDTQGPSQLIVDGDLVFDYAASADTRALQRLYKLAVVEILRIRAASPTFLPPPRNHGTASANEERDRFAYEERMKNPQTSCGEIRKAIKAKGWEPLQSDQGVRAAADRYAVRHKLPPVPRQN